MRFIQIILILLFTLYTSSLFSQSYNNKEEEEPVYEYVNKRAHFPGGDFALYEYLHSSIDFSQKNLERKKEGPVQVNFIVEKDGSISHIELRMSLVRELDKQVLDAVSNMPKWESAELLGKRVRSYNSVKVHFMSEHISYEEMAKDIYKYQYPIQRAMKSLEVHHYREAVAYFSMYLSEYPKDAFALYYRGGALYNLGRHREACIDWKDSQEDDAKEVFSVYCEGMRGVKYYSSVDTNYQKFLDTLAVVEHCSIDFDSMAYFSNNPNALRRFYKKNMPKYLIKKYNIPKVLVSFNVNIDGSIENVWIVRSYSERYDQEAIRLVQKMPKWKPATKDDKAVKSKVLLGIEFNDKSTKTGKAIHNFFAR